MTTPNKIQANRLNAQKSTGPRTPEGKAKSSQNAITHGLCSARPVLAVENKDEFDRFANDFIANLDPLNPVEEFLSRRIACLAWRLQRAARYETLVLDNLCKTSDSDPGQSADEALGQILTDDFRNQRTLEKIQRYETQLERSMLRCTKQLRVLRNSNLINYTDIREYVRGYQPRDPLFKDEPNVDEPSVLRNNNPQNEPKIENCNNEPTPGSGSVIIERGEESLPSLDSGLSSMNSLQNEPKEPLPKDWAKKVLDKVHYPLHKRRMSQPKLNKLADSVLMNLEDPEKFLHDIAAVAC
ncbi:MAG: hypothetical protein FJ263_03135 [Planctomycetes bacterium]|nr:hypothetical protein [Planctomycetota bacterium]